MQFRELELGGAFVIESEAFEDNRGSFTRWFCAREFAERGLPAAFVQCSLSRNHRRGTLRGLHFQRHPHQEGKLVRCLRGRIFDVIVDLRRSSPGYGRWVGVELDATSSRALFVPAGFAHGFQTLEDNSDVLYQITEFHTPSAADGIRWNDPKLAIAWPLADPVVSERDRQLMYFDP